MPATPVHAIILAAGLGSRLGGRPKAAIEFGDRSILEHLAAAFKDAGIGTTSVVIGPYRDQLLPLAKRCGLHVIEHPQEGASLLDSQRLALRTHAADAPQADLILTVADLPLLRSSHVRPLLEAWCARVTGTHALVPWVADRRGHPVILSKEAVLDLNAAPPEVGVRHWLAAHAEAVAAFPSSDRAYVSDVDTPADLEALRALTR